MYSNSLHRDLVFAVQEIAVAGENKALQPGVSIDARQKGKRAPKDYIKSTLLLAARQARFNGPPLPSLSLLPSCLPSASTVLTIT